MEKTNTQPLQAHDDASSASNDQSSVAKTQPELSLDQKLTILLNQYEHLQSQVVLARQSRDVRVNWFTAILVGVLGSIGLFWTNTTEEQKSLVVILLFLSLIALAYIGHLTIKSAWSYNRMDIVSRIEMHRLREWLINLDPQLAATLKWQVSPHMQIYWPSWPFITAAITAAIQATVAFFILYVVGVLLSATTPLFANYLISPPKPSPATTLTHIISASENSNLAPTTSLTTSSITSSTVTLTSIIDPNSQQTVEVVPIRFLSLFCILLTIGLWLIFFNCYKAHINKDRKILLDVFEISVVERPKRQQLW